MSLVYEVDLHVDVALAGSLRDWLPGHVHRVLQQPGFESARIYEATQQDTTLNVCVHYCVTDAQALQAYLDGAAHTLRAEGVRRFGDALRARRRVLRPIFAE